MNFIGHIYDWELFKRDVRTDVRNSALYMFFFYAIYFTAAIIMESVYMVKNSDILQGMLSSSGGGGQAELTEVIDSMQGGEMAGLMSIAGIAIGGCVFFIYRKRRYITDLALPAAEPMTPKIFIVLVLATQFIQLIYGLAIMLIDELLPEGLSLADSYGEAMEALVTPLGVVYVVLIGPVFEELVFRGAVMGPLRRFGDNFAIIFTSLLFGFYHMVMLQIPFGFAMGLLLGYVATRWSLRASIVLHIIVNGLSSLFSDTEGEGFADAGGIIMIACTIATAVMLIKWRKQFRARIRAGAAFYPHTYSSGFSSIAFWLFLTVMTFGGLAQMGVFGGL